MEPHVAAAFSEQVKTEAAVRFGAVADGLELLGDHENYVFGFVNRDGERQVLRVTHPIHRSKGQILSELHWVTICATTEWR